MRVHLVGVSGTGMGALAALLRQAGDEVSGSDVAFDPPVGPMLHAPALLLQRQTAPVVGGRTPPLKAPVKPPLTITSPSKVTTAT